MTDPVDRVLFVLARFILIKREVDWLRRNEPEEFDRLKDELRKVMGDDSSTAKPERGRGNGSARADADIQEAGPSED